jgi:hypothetical protein
MKGRLTSWNVTEARWIMTLDVGGGYQRFVGTGYKVPLQTNLNAPRKFSSRLPTPDLVQIRSAVSVMKHGSIRLQLRPHHACNVWKKAGRKATTLLQQCKQRTVYIQCDCNYWRITLQCSRIHEATCYSLRRRTVTDCCLEFSIYFSLLRSAESSSLLTNGRFRGFSLNGWRY